MDPFRQFGFSEHEIKTKDDFDKVRKVVNRRWKEAREKKDTFNMKHLDQTFKHMQAIFDKGGKTQLKGMSASTRKMDQFFEAQTEEMRKNRVCYYYENQFFEIR